MPPSAISHVPFKDLVLESRRDRIHAALGDFPRPVQVYYEPSFGFRRFLLCGLAAAGKSKQ